MKRVLIHIGSAELPMCFSLRVVDACAERFGGLDGLDAALAGSDDPMKALRNCVWLLAQMLEAGRRYDALNGAEAPFPPAEDELLDLFGLDDLASLRGELARAMSAGSQRSIEVEPEKNGTATREDRGT